MLSGRLNRRYIGAVAAFFITVSTYIYYRSELSVNHASQNSTEPHNTLPCSLLPGANDVVVILKTGSTELQSKLPVHLNTTLNCYPHHLIFSDHAEQYQDETILDALADVSPIFQTSHEDFALYRQLQQSGRESLDLNELSSASSNAQDGKKGKPRNPGWTLDKWKFLPMLHNTLQQHPSKSWYVFAELDTYILWSTLLPYLSTLPPNQKIYIGSQNEIGSVVYAHGGSGFAVSRPALEAAVELYVANKDEWETYTASHWAGDCVLGKLMADSGTELTWAWPIWQGDGVGRMNWSEADYGRRVWCWPSVSYHHLGPEGVLDLWEFEQMRISLVGEGRGQVLRQKDVFAEYVLPRTIGSRLDWDNHAGDDRGVVASLDECRGICEEEASCLQYAYDQTGTCLITEHPNLGEASPGIQSGWLQERMQSFHDNAEPCGDEGLIV